MPATPVNPVIVIFGAAVRPDGSPSGALRGRVEAAIALGKTLRNPVYMPTGGQGRYGRPEAIVMADMLAAAGIDRASIQPETQATNTMSSAQACARMLGPTAAAVYVATSAYHMPRCVLLLRLEGLRARPGRAATGAASARWSKRWYWRLRELAAIPLDTATLRAWRLRGR